MASKDDAGPPPGAAMSLQRIAVAGAGRMGRGLALMFAYAGRPVALLDIKDRDEAGVDALKVAARAEIETNLEFLASCDLLSGAQVQTAVELVAIQGRAGASKPLEEADFVIEAVPETRKAKAQAFEWINRHSKADAIVASTTSSMLVTELQQLVARPSRFLNAHFLNPAHLIPLVEVSPGPDTEEKVTQEVMALFEALGKAPVRCAAAPGYIIPRLQSLLMAEACRMVEEGVATPADIDRAIIHGFGPRYATLGVMEFIDWGGVDILYYAGRYLAQALDSPRHAPPETVARMMEDGRKGLRAGQGYYDFRGMDADAWQKEKLRRLVDLLKGLGQMPTPGV